MQNDSALPVKGSRWRTAWFRVGLVVLLVCFLFGALLVSTALWLGYWLMVEQPLQPAGAIVVLGGGVPFRALEAAFIYQGGWAPEVWVTRRGVGPGEAVFIRLGVPFVGEETYSRAVLERLGVPPRAIRVLDEGVSNTADELQLVAKELAAGRGEGVILVTSKAHSRRVSVIWRKVTGEYQRGIVRYARDDPYDPGRWWQNTGDALAVMREVFGLINAWADFPLQPKSHTPVSVSR